MTSASPCQNEALMRTHAGVPVLLLDGMGNGLLVYDHEPLPASRRQVVKPPAYVVKFNKTEVFHEGARIYLLDGVKQVPRVRKVIREP
jgi:hypothetical protein